MKEHVKDERGAYLWADPPFRRRASGEALQRTFSQCIKSDEGKRLE